MACGTGVSWGCRERRLQDWGGWAMRDGQEADLPEEERQADLGWGAGLVWNRGN